MGDSNFWKGLIQRWEATQLAVRRKLRRDLRMLLLAPSRMITEEVYRIELTKCTGRDLARFANSLVLLAEHEKAVHKRPGSLLTIINDLIDALSNPHSKEGRKLLTAISMMLAARGYDPDDDTLGDDGDPLMSEIAAIVGREGGSHE